MNLVPLPEATYNLVRLKATASRYRQQESKCAESELGSVMDNRTSKSILCGWTSQRDCCMEELLYILQASSWG